MWWSGQWGTGRKETQITGTEEETGCRTELSTIDSNDTELQDTVALKDTCQLQWPMGCQGSRTHLRGPLIPDYGHIIV